MPNHHTLIIAEAGVNHNGDLNLALQLVDAAADAGADIVKFQTFKADKLAGTSAKLAQYQAQNLGQAPEDSQVAMLRKLELSPDAHHTIFEHCQKRKIQFLSTPFDAESLQFLVQNFPLPFIKIPSGELTHAPFLLAITKTQLPVVLSTGMATLAEIETALGVLAYGYYTEQSSITKPTRQAFRQAYLANAHRLREKVTLLHCTTEYPAPLDTVNLRAMATMAHAFLLPVGFSDHTVGISIPIAAVALGAVIIEKHFTVDQNLPGPDHKASLEPQALADMVQGIRAVEQALGSGIKAPFAVEEANAAIARKSLTAIQDIQAGETFTNQNLGCMRPGYGIEPIMYYDYLGKRATQNYHAGALIDE